MSGARRKWQIQSELGELEIRIRVIRRQIDKSSKELASINARIQHLRAELAIIDDEDDER